jgi:hypothetical protein
MAPLRGSECKIIWNYAIGDKNCECLALNYRFVSNLAAYRRPDERLEAALLSHLARRA